MRAMNRIVILLVLFFLLMNVCVPLFSSDRIDLSFLRYSVFNNTDLIFLTETSAHHKFVDKDTLTEYDSSEDFELAVYPIENLSGSLKQYFSSTDKSSSFLFYRVSNQITQGYLSINVLSGIDLHYNRARESYYHFYKGLQLRANIHNRLIFWGRWWGGHFNGDLDYVRNKSHLLNGFYKDHSNHTRIYINRLAGQIRYHSAFGKLAVGRDKFNIGNNIAGSIIINDDCNEYGYFSSEINLGRIRLSFLHGMLIPDREDDLYPYRSYNEKHIALHQIDLDIHRNLNVFFGENIVYGNRGIDLSYLLPHTFYRITEHNLRDRDNVKIYCGLEWTFRERHFFYFNFILDELRKSEIFTDWWGNKYAAQLGYTHYLSSSESNFLRDRISFELTAVRPWTYTHKTLPTKYSHDGTGLGFPKGSNLVQISSEINKKILPCLNFKTFWSLTRQGDLGNCYSINYDYRPKDTAKWLEGEKSDFLDGRIVFELIPSSHHRLKFGLDFKQVNKSSMNTEYVVSYQTIY